MEAIENGMLMPSSMGIANTHEMEPDDSWVDEGRTVLDDLEDDIKWDIRHAEQYIIEFEKTIKKKKEDPREEYSRWYFEGLKKGMDERLQMLREYLELIQESKRQAG